MPVVSKSFTSSYAKIASRQRKLTEIAETNSPRSTITGMDCPEDASGKEESKLSDKSDSNASTSEENNIPPKKTEKNENSTTATGAITPNQSSGAYPQVIPPHDTPRQPNYYGGYHNSQVTPESPSTSNSGNGRGAVYDGASFFRQQSAAGFHTNSPFSTSAGPSHQYAGNSVSQQTPHSPTQSMSAIPPASPLFPRMTGPMQTFINASRGGASAGNQAMSMSPVPSAYVSSGGMYIPGNSYPILAGRPNASSNSTNSINETGSGSNTNEEFMTWNENRNMSYPVSPGHGIPYVPGMPQRSDRSSSFDDSVLPSGSDSSSVHHAPNNAYGAGPGGGPTQAWGYGGPPPDVSQGRSGAAYPGQHGGPQFRHLAQYNGPYGGHYGFPTTSPGPPIQTTSSNKGPDGSNLFIFHIPNHFTNLDMYQLFCPYGNLFSVRIMVEKDTGRSRGFGFVSYDNPDAAALAIKELNGFAIGNKRLKVQHKQIRPVDQQDRIRGGSGGGIYFNGNCIQQNQGRGDGRGRGALCGREGTNRPPHGPSSGSMAMSSTGWYDDDRNQSSPPSSAQNLSSGDLGTGDPNHVNVVLGDDPNSPNVTAAASVQKSGGGGNTSKTTNTELDDQHHQQKQQQQGNNADPLSSMENLRQNLPDILEA